VTQAVQTTEALDPHRLPRHTLPSRYALELEPDLDGASFRGSVDITVTCSDAPDTVVLNAIELDIDRVRFDGVDAEFRLDVDTERLFVTPGRPVGRRRAPPRVEFDGVLNDKLRGFYRSTSTATPTVPST
jgi:puromycin-sensitive aminopeptidase